MEKALEILEKNVQWIVLGIAALFLGWVAYAYIVTPPAVVKIGSKEVLPSDIASYTQKGVATTLQDKIKTGHAQFPTPDLVADWRTKMVQPFQVAIGTNWTQGQTLEESFGSPTNLSKVHVAGLPVLPKAIIPAPPLAGMSVVSTPPPAGGAAPVAAAPAVTAAPGAAVVNPGRDLEWVVGVGSIPAKALSDAMTAPLKGQPINALLYNTQLLQVVMQRQQATGLDDKGNPIFPSDDKFTDVAPLVIDPTQVVAMPQSKDDADTKYKYLDWAGQHQDLIATPPFYTVLAGTQFAPPLPGVGPAAPPAVAPATAPAPAPAQPPATPATPNASPQASIHRIGQANASYAPYDPRNPHAAPFPMAPGANPGFQQPPFNPMPQPNFNANANANANGPVDPFLIQSDIQFYAIDQNVKPGQWYRYRFIYKMKNPVFLITNMADDKLINQFALVSPPSDWSAPVQVPNTTEYYLASVTGNKMDSARLDLFQWSGGQWSVKHLALGPGDPVPGTDATVVDIRASDSRQPPRERYVLLTTEDGKIDKRDPTSDAAKDKYQDLLNQTNAGGTAPGGPGAAPPPVFAPPVNPHRPVRPPSNSPTR